MSRCVRRFSVRAACLLGLGVLALATPSNAQSSAEIQQAVDAAYGKFRTPNEGKNADYIPALDDAGNSIRAQRAIADISAALGANPDGAKAAAAQPAEPKPSFEIYGFAMLDIGHDFKQIDPDWFDTLRVTKLPRFENQFGENNSTFTGVRQSRLGFKSSTPTPVGELKTIFEFELFGTGADSGQTTFRLRHAWGELGALGAGQYWSPFSDPDVYPNTLEYWGPTGIPWYRNVQLRYTPIRSDSSNLMIALARPGASGDQGVYADRIELQGIKARFPLPDFVAAYKYTQDWGYVRAAGILRRINWDDTLDDALDLSGNATGWGLNVSSNLKAGEKRRADAVHIRRRRSERNERLAGRHRHPEQLLEPGDANSRQTDTDRRLQHVPGSHLEREVQQRDRVSRRTTTTPTARRLTPSGSESTRLATCSTTRCRT